MTNPIKKGKNFERAIANMLTKLLGCKFHRVPMSGAFSTSFNTNSPQFKGDVFTEQEGYKDIVIECKNYKGLAIVDFFNRKSKIYSWIEQSITESKSNPWILFFKINHIGTFVVFSKAFLGRMLYYQIYTKLWSDSKRYSSSVMISQNFEIYMIKNP